MEIQSLMTYCQRLFALNGEKRFLFQAHENKLLHLSLMGKEKSYVCDAFLTHHFRNEKLLAVMYFMVQLLDLFM